MTARGLALVASAALLAGWGWWARWPELIGLGAGLALLVALCLALALLAPRGDLVAAQSAVTVVRGEPASVGLRLSVRGPRWWARVVDGKVAAPNLSVRLPHARGESTLRLPVDTSRRGQRQLGPFSVVHGDPWGVVRRVVATTSGGVLTVRPRSYAMRRSLTAAFRVGDAETASRRSGDQHFHALRDYVLGDEPRTVHWRSSARAGKLVVRQHVSAASTGTTIVLDVDGSAYVTGARFGVNWDAELFESAVEVAASLATSQLGRSEQVHLVTTARGATVLSASLGAANALLDALAVVEAVPPTDTAPDEMSSIVRRTRAAHTIVITSDPSPRTAVALRRLVSAGRTSVVRVGGDKSLEISGARVVTVTGVAEMVAAT